VQLQKNVKQILLEFLFFELQPPTDGNCIEDQFVINGQGNKNQIKYDGFENIFLSRIKTFFTENCSKSC
jgi:hypothetical protein